MGTTKRMQLEQMDAEENTWLRLQCDFCGETKPYHRFGVDEVEALKILRGEDWIRATCLDCRHTQDKAD